MSKERHENPTKRFKWATLGLVSRKKLSVSCCSASAKDPLLKAYGIDALHVVTVICGHCGAHLIQFPGACLKTPPALERPAA